MTKIGPAMHHHRHPSSPTVASGPVPRRGFTLVELLVAVVIMLILSSLMLSGMAIARSRARGDRTRTTIRKIHDILMPHYANYVRRRVPLPAGLTTPRAVATERLRRIRTLSLYEMPDSWADVANSGTDARVGNGAQPIGTGTVPLPGYAWNGVAQAYGAFRTTVAATGFAANGAAECLYLIVARGTQEPDTMEHFRNDEIGDTDGDGAPEFIDGWGEPIIFLRWAPGFASPVQISDPVNRHDPLDPQRVDDTGYALVPLVVSGGPDRRTGLQVTVDGWSRLSLQSIVGSGSTIGAPDGTGNDADNITNHDLIRK